MLFFFFQAEDGIRDGRVTGVQTCALPISVPKGRIDFLHHVILIQLRVDCGDLSLSERVIEGVIDGRRGNSESRSRKIGRASCRERVEMWVGGGALKKKRAVMEICGTI